MAISGQKTAPTDRFLQVQNVPNMQFSGACAASGPGQNVQISNKFALVPCCCAVGPARQWVPNMREGVLSQKSLYKNPFPTSPSSKACRASMRRGRSCAICSIVFRVLTRTAAGAQGTDTVSRHAAWRLSNDRWPKGGGWRLSAAHHSSAVLPAAAEGATPTQRQLHMSLGPESPRRRAD